MSRVFSNREMYGHRLPDGMRPHEQLPQPIITPTTKAGHGDHTGRMVRRRPTTTFGSG
jgi:phosphoribosylaminoimidazole-succinocarboxamide synthase